jgi:hypothetical protein
MMITLNESTIEPQSEIFSKDGASIEGVQSFSVGASGVGSISIENGIMSSYDDAGTLRLIWSPIEGIKQFDSSGDVRSEWLNDGVRQVYDSSGNVVIKENPDG